MECTRSLRFGNHPITTIFTFVGTTIQQQQQQQQQRQQQQQLKKLKQVDIWPCYGPLSLHFMKSADNNNNDNNNNNNKSKA